LCCLTNIKGKKIKLKWRSKIVPNAENKKKGRGCGKKKEKRRRREK
jgi:hypothetical protein